MHGVPQSYLRCSMCAISYPNSAAHTDCDVCGEKTSRMQGSGPDADWEERVRSQSIERMIGADSQPDDKVWQHRRNEFFKLGFNLRQSEILASTKDRDDLTGVYLWWANVKGVLDKAIAKGVPDPHLVVFDIFA